MCFFLSNIFELRELSLRRTIQGMEIVQIVGLRVWRSMLCCAAGWPGPFGAQTEYLFAWFCTWICVYGSWAGHNGGFEISGQEKRSRVSLLCNNAHMHHEEVGCQVILRYQPRSIPTLTLAVIAAHMTHGNLIVNVTSISKEVEVCWWGCDWNQWQCLPALVLVDCNAVDDSNYIQQL